jgi:hypothetical protein
MLILGGTFLALTFNIIDMLIVLLIIIATYYLVRSTAYYEESNVTVFIFGLTLGKASKLLIPLKVDGDCKIKIFITGFILLLSLSFWRRLDSSWNYYNGPRWMGLWDNPNTYGILMSTGITLAIGLIIKMVSGGWRGTIYFKSFLVILLIATVMMSGGLIFSYSRGAWLGAVISLLYLAKAYGKFKWRYVLSGAFAMAVMTWSFWNATLDSAPWYIKRLDLSRPSAQHRVAAWKAGFEIMRDHPFGVGWDNAIKIYQEEYSPPQDGAEAIATNDYLMLGIQLGIPALLCFLAYVALCFGAQNWWRKRPSPTGDSNLEASDPKLKTQDSEFKIKVACRAATLSLLVAFWFDDGLFNLPTAAIFWILLELGAYDRRTKIQSSPIPNAA